MPINYALVLFSAFCNVINNNKKVIITIIIVLIIIYYRAATAAARVYACVYFNIIYTHTHSVYRRLSARHCYFVTISCANRTYTYVYIIRAGSGGYTITAAVTYIIYHVIYARHNIVYCSRRG